MKKSSAYVENELEERCLYYIITKFDQFTADYFN